MLQYRPHSSSADSNELEGTLIVKQSPLQQQRTEEMDTSDPSESKLI